MMVKSKNSNNFLILIMGSVFFIAANILQSKIHRPILVISKQQSAVTLNQNFINFFSLGNKRLISDMIWIQTLLESDTEKYGLHDKNSWMFHRFRSISELDPLFYQNYLWGGQYLSIVKDDLEGASEIYGRGLIHFPNDYKLNFNNGFNYYFELGEFEKGLYYLKKIVNHPDLPDPLKHVINKLEFETSGDYDTALNFLILSYEQNSDETIRKKLLAEIYSLKAEKDLNCLNKGELGCDKNDAEGIPYVFKNGTYKAHKEFTPFRIHKKNRPTNNR